MFAVCCCSLFCSLVRSLFHYSSFFNFQKVKLHFSMMSLEQQQSSRHNLLVSFNYQNISFPSLFLLLLALNVHSKNILLLLVSVKSHGVVIFLKHSLPLQLTVGLMQTLIILLVLIVRIVLYRLILQKSPKHHLHGEREELNFVPMVIVKMVCPRILLIQFNVVVQIDNSTW